MTKPELESRIIKNIANKFKLSPKFNEKAGSWFVGIPSNKGMYYLIDNEINEGGTCLLASSHSSDYVKLQRKGLTARLAKALHAIGVKSSDCAKASIPSSTKDAGRLFQEMLSAR